MKYHLITIILFLVLAISASAQTNETGIANSETYLDSIKVELQKKWPKNRTINVVFHGHSVPSGYFNTPQVNTLSAYPYLFLSRLKSLYPYAVVNVIVTGIGGESSDRGAKRFDDQVLNHNPDVLFIDYALNDRRIGLDSARMAWVEMIKKTKERGIPLILLTPSPDTRVDFLSPDNKLKQHTDQIITLAQQYNVGVVDSYKAFSFLYDDKVKLEEYMAQVNHPNEKGHALIADEIVKWFE